MHFKLSQAESTFYRGPNIDFALTFAIYSDPKIFYSKRKDFIYKMNLNGCSGHFQKVYY
jgi:hypothetical protein